MSTKLNGLSEIYTYFRKNSTPWYFVSPTSFNVLGIDQWVHKFEYINYFDSFDGSHPRVVIPREHLPREFQSMEEMVNYLLQHKEVIDHFKARGGGGKILTVMFDDETEEIAKDLGMEIALPSNELRQRLDSKIETTRVANEAGVESAPNTMGRADSYEALMALVNQAGLGNDLVVQTPYGDSGRTTFFISSEADWDKHASKMVDEELKIMKRINHIPGTLEAVATRHGTLVGPMMTDITGFAELTPYKGGWCGNDVSTQLISKKLRDKIQKMASALGERLYQEGYRGVFCLDFLIDTDNDEVYLGEINPRISGASPPTNLITSKYGGVPLMLFHLLEFSDVDYEIDMQSIQSRWTDYDAWSQLVLKQTEDKVELISSAPQSGIWRLKDDGQIEFVRQTIDWHNVGDENEAYYMRVYGAGEYRYHGADMGILVSRGRMQTDDRKLSDRAKTWASQIMGQFEGVAPPPEAPVIPPDIDFRKMF